MKKIILLILCLIHTSVYAEPITISLDQVALQVKERDLTILQNAERVYQAREAVQVARMNLLPKLNLWKIVGVALDWKSALGVVEDLVPFLVPGNWFRAKEQKLFYEAESIGLKALKGNEILNAKALFFQVRMDEKLLERITDAASAIFSVLDYTKVQEQFGEVPIGTSASIEMQYLALLDDKKALINLILQEKENFGMMMGLPAHSNIILKEVDDTDISSQPKLRYEELESTIVRLSPELEQYSLIIEAAKYVKKEITFSFLGMSSLSRGVMGGIFDQYPVQSGLGFGLGASVRIAKSEREQLVLQQKAATETLKRQLSVLIENINREIESYTNIKRRVSLAHSYYSSLRTRMELGEKVSSLELVEASKSKTEAIVDYLGAMSRFSIDQDRLLRMKLEGDYRDLQ